jgi:hypothetical protein
MKLDMSASSWDVVARRTLLTRPSPDEFIGRVRFLWGLFGKRLAQMPPWMADEFTSFLAGVARGPRLDFEIRCGMQRLVLGLHQGAQEAERERG